MNDFVNFTFEFVELLLEQQRIKTDKNFEIKTKVNYDKIGLIEETFSWKDVLLIQSIQLIDDENRW